MSRKKTLIINILSFLNIMAYKHNINIQMHVFWKIHFSPLTINGLSKTTLLEMSRKVLKWVNTF